jgi:hypothetical protein
VKKVHFFRKKREVTSEFHGRSGMILFQIVLIFLKDRRISYKESNIAMGR